MASYKTDLYINGKWLKPVLGGTFQTINPATGEVITDVANATSEDIDLAISSAKATLFSDNWGHKSTGKQRAVILRNIGNIIESRKDELAKLDSLDQGKPLREALADMGDAVSACSHFATLAEELDGKQYEDIDNGTNGDFTTKILYEPIGVIGAITPWNYPFLMGIWKVIPAIAAGCTIVLKPSELAPLTCLLLAEICTEAGLPHGALNVVTGLGADAGGPLSNHDGIDKVSFTGSVPTAKKIMAAAALGPRAISLELGGKSPLLVFEDADIPSAVDWILTGILWGSGQVCSATSRVLVHNSIKDQLLTKLLERVQEIKIGDSLSQEFLSYEGPAMGPVISKGQYDKIWAYIDKAIADGITLFYGGDRKLVETLGPGYFIPPTIFIDVPTTSAIWKEEIFGPVLSIRSFELEEEAIYSANNTEYGLAAAVFSADKERVTRVSRALRAGVVWENCCQPAFIQAPWGGYKKSGFGRELGRWGLEEFLGVKQITGCSSGFSWGLW
eukprot:gene20723-26867_t